MPDFDGNIYLDRLRKAHETIFATESEPVRLLALGVNVLISKIEKLEQLIANIPKPKTEDEVFQEKVLSLLTDTEGYCRKINTRTKEILENQLYG